jgi:hypothetical protein
MAYRPYSNGFCSYPVFQKYVTWNMDLNINIKYKNKSSLHFPKVELDIDYRGTGKHSLWI